MHTRMVELLSQIEEEGLVCQLLDLIDKLNNTFIRYCSASANRHVLGVYYQGRGETAITS